MVSQKEMRLAAKEMIKVLGLVDDDKEPLVVSKDATVKELQKLIEDAIPLIDPKTDKFSEETDAVIAEFSEKKAKKPQRYEAPAEDDDEPEADETEKDDADDDDDDKPEEKPAKKEKPAAKKPAKDDDDDDDEPKEEKKPTKKPVSPPRKREPKERVPSAYGTSVEIMCGDPDMSMEKLVKELQKLGIDTKAGKSAVNTGYGVVRKVVSILRKNGLMPK